MENQNQANAATQGERKRETCTLWIFTRTPLHVGAGASLGAVDMTIARERHTGSPIIPGSGLKGALRDEWSDNAQEQEELFGPDTDHADKAAGALIVGEARCVCFPVRSAKNAFAWLTSPMALMRLARDRGKSLSEISLNDDECLASDRVVVKDTVVLEEYAFKRKGPVPEEALSLLTDASDDDLWKSLKDRLVIVSDGIFSHFCTNACEVQQRIRIDDDKGTVVTGGLFNQENVPSETLFYAVISERKPGAVQKFRTKGLKVIQIGGDETIGLGWCSLCVQ